jgi:hypothetical protein
VSWRVALVCVALAGGAFALGRASVDTDAPQPSSLVTQKERAQGRAVGLREGRALGVREGRALQTPATGRRAFKAGYVAGANDVFGGFDGGWALGARYVVTVARGSHGVTYRFDSRRPLGHR